MCEGLSGYMKSQSFSYWTGIPGSWLTIGGTSREPWERCEDEHHVSSTYRRPVGEGHTSVRGHAASIRPELQGYW